MSREIRLQKFIADCGITSRRKAEELILQGRVEINGEIVSELGTKVSPDNDVVIVDGQIADLAKVKPVYIVMHKPRGYMTTLHDPEGRKTIMDLCQEVSERVYPVGRLDYLSEGLLVLTNDGEVANQIIHPRYNITKVYEVKVFGALSMAILKKLRDGVVIDGRLAQPLSVRVIKQLPTKTWLEFRLGEGRNREIRNICESCGLTVDKLKRVAIGGLSIEGIAPGGFRYLTKNQLLDTIGMKSDSLPKRNTQYISPKKTINVKSKRFGRKYKDDLPQADDQTFVKFRREHYFQSLKRMSEIKKEIEKRERTQAYMEKEEARKKRLFKKEKRKAIKNQKAPHAEFVD